MTKATATASGADAPEPFDGPSDGPPSAEDRLDAVEAALVRVAVKLDALNVVFEERLELMNELNASIAGHLERQSDAISALAVDKSKKGDTEAV